MIKHKICKILLVILAIFLCVVFYELLGICVAYKKQPEVSNTIERTVTDEQYKVIEEVYMWHPSIRNTSGKDEVAELYKSFGMTIFHL